MSAPRSRPPAILVIGVVGAALCAAALVALQIIAWL